MRTPGAALAVGSLLLLAAPAAYAEPIRPGEESTLDLGILPPSTPGVLKAAATAPYAVPAGSDCGSIAREIAALDEVLGPDADALKASGVDAGRIVGQAVKSLIPYRSVVRFVTGADRKQRERDRAAMAGWARRGYLKATLANLGCPGAPAAPVVAAPVVAVAEPASPRIPARVGGARPATLATVEPPRPETAEPTPHVRLGRIDRPGGEKIETTFSR